MSKLSVGKCQQRKCQYKWSGWKMLVRNLRADTSDPVGKCLYGHIGQVLLCDRSVCTRTTEKSVAAWDQRY
jgi:hypothetical protein